MKYNLTFIITYLGILYVALVPASKPSRLLRADRNPLIEGSGSGPGADDEDSGRDSRPPLPTQGGGSGRVSGFPKPRMRSPSDLTPPRDEGSGANPDEERKPRLPPPVAMDPVTKRPLVGRPRLPTTRRLCALASRGGGSKPPYKPNCSPDGNFQPLQCSTYDCFCVEPINGNIIEKTRTVPKDEIVCKWMRFQLYIPLDTTKSISRQELARLKTAFSSYADSPLMGGHEVITFTQFVNKKNSYADEPMAALYELRSIGHPKNRLRTLLPNLRQMVQKMRESGYPISYPRDLHITPLSKDDRLPGQEVGRPPVVIDEPPPKDQPLSGDEPREHHRMMRTVNGAYTVVQEPGNNNPNVGKPGDEPQKPNRSASTKTREDANKKGGGTLLNQPGIIAAIIGGGIAGFFLTILLILFCIYRIRKKDEGSYALEEPKKTPVTAAVYHSAPTREYYA